MPFVDESSKVYVGRFLLPNEILPWLQAQKKPAWVKYVCTHHTWSPTYDQWSGLSTLNAVFNYYKTERGWPAGMGPHFWVAPQKHDGPIGVWIGTHPSRVGIGASGWNSDTLHCEYAWNGDISPFTDPVLTAGAALMGALDHWIGIPLEPVDFAGGWAVKGKMGHLFHRDTPKANKTCPGTKNTHELVFGAYKEKNPMSPLVPGPPEPYPTNLEDWTPEARWLQERGIVSGFADGSFRSGVYLTRGQLAIALKRLYEVIIKDVGAKV